MGALTGRGRLLEDLRYIRTLYFAPKLLVNYITCILLQKAGPPSYRVLDDVYFGFEERRSLCYYFAHLSSWYVAYYYANCAFLTLVLPPQLGSCYCLTASFLKNSTCAPWMMMMMIFFIYQGFSGYIGKQWYGSCSTRKNQ